MITYYDALIDDIKEPGVIDIILDYKVCAEDAEIICNYNEDWFLISQSVSDKSINESFLLRHIDKVYIDLMMSNPNRNYSENFLNNIFHLLSDDAKRSYFNKFNVSLSFLLEHNLFFLRNFFATYFLEKKDTNLKMFNHSDIIIILKYFCDFINDINIADMQLFFKAIIKTHKIDLSLIEYLFKDSDNFLFDNFDFDYCHKVDNIVSVTRFDKKTIFYLLSFNEHIEYTVEFLKKHRMYIKWHSLTYNKYLHEGIIREFPSMFDWHELSSHMNVSEGFLKSNIHKIHFHNLSNNSNIHLSDDFLITYFDISMINNRLKYQPVGKLVFELNKNQINWNMISEYQTLSDEDVVQFSKYVNWSNISRYQKNISEKIFDIYHKNVDFYLLSKYQKLSEVFINRYKKKVDWDFISQYQVLSRNFIKKHKKSLNMTLVVKYQKSIDLDMIIEKYSKN